MSDLDNNTYYGKISTLCKKINKLDSKEITEAIKSIQEQKEKTMSKVNLQYKNKEVSNEKEVENIVPFIKDNIESINRSENQRASGGEER